MAPNAYAALAARSDLAHIGGAEVQQVLIAKALRQRGYSVCFVTWDHGQPDAVAHDGIQVFKACRVDAGCPGVRFLHPRWTSLYAALKRANADVYYQRTAGCETGQTALWCRCHRRPFVFASASESNCSPLLPGLRGRRERALYRFGLRRATRIVCQTFAQRLAFERHFGIHATLIRSCAADPFDGRRLNRSLPRRGPYRLLWVARFHSKKRPEWLLRLAQACPDFVFDIVGDGRRSDPGVEDFLSRAARLPSVTCHGRVPHERIGSYYDQAHLLICTSLDEGYPNTFMEAWARGTPVVSSFDPDGVIARHGLGAVGGSIAQLRDASQRLLSSPGHWADCSQNAREFFLETHTISAAADAYETLLAQLTMPSPFASRRDEARLSQDF